MYSLTFRVRVMLP